MTARFDLIGLVVADMARSMAFYRRLGFDLPASADGEPPLEPFDAFWGMRYATVLDPDDNGVDLFATLAGGASAPDPS